MIILGLTGSIGMGKSTVAAMFMKQGVPVFDADAEVHRLQGPNGALIARIESRFPGTTGSQGVDRQKLGAAVWNRPDELHALERIIHPAVAESRRRFLKRHRARALVVLDIPLLFEKKGFRQVDAVAVVSAPAWKQARRVLARPNMTPQKFKQIKRLQTPDVIKRRRADYVINTGCLRIETYRAVRNLIACISPKKGR
jgi:dephospho-CoA kinase